MRSGDRATRRCTTTRSLLASFYTLAGWRRDCQKARRRGTSSSFYAFGGGGVATTGSPVPRWTPGRFYALAGRRPLRRGRKPRVRVLRQLFLCPGGSVGVATTSTSAGSPGLSWFLCPGGPVAVATPQPAPELAAAMAFLCPGGRVGVATGLLPALRGAGVLVSMSWRAGGRCDVPVTWVTWR